MLCVPEAGPGPAPRLHSGLLPAPPWSPHPLPSLTSTCLNLPFGTQGRSWRLNEAYFLKTRSEGHRTAFGPRGRRALLGLVSDILVSLALEMPLTLLINYWAFSFLSSQTFGNTHFPCCFVSFSSLFSPKSLQFGVFSLHSISALLSRISNEVLIFPVVLLGCWSKNYGPEGQCTERCGDQISQIQTLAAGPAVYL